MNSAANPVIELEKVSVALGGRIVLEDITFQVHPGEFLAVLGPNGSGKTTLLRTILGQIQPISGKVLVFGKSPDQLNAERTRIGYVPQIETVDRNFPIHVEDLVLMGRYARLGLFKRPATSDRDAARQAMARVGIEHLADRPFAELSGGERQRAFLARALTGEPEVLLLDEPTAGVDLAAAEDFYQQIHHLQDDLNLTLMMVSHDVGVVSKHVHQIACLNRVLVAHGRPEEALTPDALRCMYGKHAMLTGHDVTPHVFLDSSEHEKES
jgi:ABC-type Mn2+/Zn2+ transport system ATPase subunit